jgi:Predicted membrane protein
MFCPKCGIKNPDDGKFCRSCGVDLGNVSAAMSGTLAPLSGHSLDAGTAHIQSESRRRSDPAEVYGDSIKSIISGVGFLIVAIVLLTTGVAGGQRWWWAMLFPAFTFLAKGISDLLKSRKMENSRAPFTESARTTFGQPPSTYSLTSTPENYISPDPRYKTGDLVPPSVTDGTTKLLEIDREDETKALPKQF